jgi:hypothetical protein
VCADTRTDVTQSTAACSTPGAQRAPCGVLTVIPLTHSGTVLIERGTKTNIITALNINNGEIILIKVVDIYESLKATAYCLIGEGNFEKFYKVHVTRDWPTRIKTEVTSKFQCEDRNNTRHQNVLNSFM